MFSLHSLTSLVSFKKQIKATHSWLPTLVLFLQTQGLDIRECVGEIKHLDHINIQQQLWLISLTSLPFVHRSSNYLSMQRRIACLTIVKDGAAYNYNNIIDINIILSHYNNCIIDSYVELMLVSQSCKHMLDWTLTLEIT